MMQLQPMMCPRCGKPLNLEKHLHGGLWRCPQCSGVAANLTVLRRQLEEDVVRGLLAQGHGRQRAFRP